MPAPGWPEILVPVPAGVVLDDRGRNSGSGAASTRRRGAGDVTGDRDATGTRGGNTRNLGGRRGGRRATATGNAAASPGTTSAEEPAGVGTAAPEGRRVRDRSAGRWGQSRARQNRTLSRRSGRAARMDSGGSPAPGDRATGNPAGQSATRRGRTRQHIGKGQAGDGDVGCAREFP